MEVTKVRLPPKLKFLFEEPWRYKVAKGGRGSAKSWSFATALLVKGAEKPCRFLCCREIQKSLQDSVHQLLKDRIQALELEKFYEVTNNGIRGKNGTQFGFEGLKHNITNIKSWEGADIAWVEEGQAVSKSSWDVLVPTIRKEGSEIWCTYNPDLEEDETHQRFAIDTPKNCKIVTINYNDNPWFPNVLKLEMEAMKEKDFSNYLNIWEGQCKEAVEGAIFAKEIREAAESGRVTTVPYDQTSPVCTYWDLGKGAMTAIWFVQYVGMQWRVLRHYSNSGEDLNHYLKYIQNLPYIYEKHYLPHDGEQKRLGMVLTVKEQVEKVLKNVQTVPRIRQKMDAINAAKQVFPLCWFDKELCADGISDLRHYAYKVTEDGKVSNEPEEGTTFRDTADAFMTFAQSCRLPKVALYDELDELMKAQLRRQKTGSGVGSAWWK